MQNSSKTLDIKSDPRYLLLESLIKGCFSSNANHSRVIAIKDNSINDEALHCPRTFDGFSCWDETPAAATAVQPCPKFVIGFDPRRLVYKTCTENGTWLMHPQVPKPWTNYTSCVDVEDLDFRSMVNNIYVGGYSVSVAALLISLAIFAYFRSLQCTRIRIHMHLFASFALNNILWIIWYRTVVNRAEVVQYNKGWCQALHVVTHYFMVSSYIWMFCEGLHLHLALVVVFVKDEVAMQWFVALGWGLSLLIVATYSVVRFYTPGATERCWMDHSDTFWIIIVPVMVSLLASFVFLVNVVRVLLTKLHPAPNQRAAVAAKKAVRATLILVPLFGLHFVLIPLRPSPDSSFEKFYQVFSALLTSLQGVCLAFLFCFTNHDVMNAMRTQLSRLFQNEEAFAMTVVDCSLLSYFWINERMHFLSGKLFSYLVLSMVFALVPAFCYILYSKLLSIFFGLVGTSIYYTLYTRLTFNKNNKIVKYCMEQLN